MPKASKWRPPTIQWKSLESRADLFSQYVCRSGIRARTHRVKHSLRLGPLCTSNRLCRRRYRVLSLGMVSTNFGPWVALPRPNPRSRFRGRGALSRHIKRPSADREGLGTSNCLGGSFSIMNGRVCGGQVTAIRPSRPALPLELGRLGSWNGIPGPRKRRRQTSKGRTPP